MGTIISWIENTYKDYQELCFLFEVRPLDINDERWVDHYRKLKDAMGEWRTQ